MHVHKIESGFLLHFFFVVLMCLCLRGAAQFVDAVNFFLCESIYHFVQNKWQLHNNKCYIFIYWTHIGHELSAMQAYGCVNVYFRFYYTATVPIY